MDLHGDMEDIRWIGALPDLLYKPSSRGAKELHASFGNLKKRSFRVNPNECSVDLANARCFQVVRSKQENNRHNYLSRVATKEVRSFVHLFVLSLA